MVVVLRGTARQDVGASYLGEQNQQTGAESDGSGMTKEEILRKLRKTEDLLGGLWLELNKARKAETDDDLYFAERSAEEAAFKAHCFIGSCGDDLEREIRNERTA